MSNLLVRVHARTLLADGVLGFEFRAQDGQSLPPFTAGAHVDVWASERLVRQYSLCNDPAETDRYQIAVQRSAVSRGGSIAMHEKIQTGALLRISAPRNLFELQPAQHSLLVAGGIGVTPLLAMAHSLHRLGVSFELHYAGRERRRMAFVDLLQASEFAERVRVYSDESGARLDAEALLATQPRGTHLYVCGPAGFMDMLLDTARRLNWPERQLHREFFAGTTPTINPDDEGFEIQIASSGLRCRVEPGQRVIDVLATHGVEVPVSCESGVCGTCLTTVLEGEPDHRDSYLTDEEKRDSRQFTPCCSRARSPVLVLDL
ncbi:MAG: oxidoreductase [Burkholderiales bacterium PBB6]|nr:MAG: oxidoreductase [Burkholderiales bacterium PBB6]